MTQLLVDGSPRSGPAAWPWLVYLLTGGEPPGPLSDRVAWGGRWRSRAAQAGDLPRRWYQGAAALEPLGWVSLARAGRLGETLSQVGLAEPPVSVGAATLAALESARGVPTPERWAAAEEEEALARQALASIREAWREREAQRRRWAAQVRAPSDEVDPAEAEAERLAVEVALADLQVRGRAAAEAFKQAEQQAEAARRARRLWDAVEGIGERFPAREHTFELAEGVRIVERPGDEGWILTPSGPWAEQGAAAQRRLDRGVRQAWLERWGLGEAIQLSS